MHRRHYLVVGATSALTPIAGCLGGDGSTDSENGDTGDNDSGNGDTGDNASGNGDTGTDGGDDQTGTGNGDDTTNSSDDADEGDTVTGDRENIESMCEIDNEVDELTIVSCESRTQGDQYVVTATIRNDGTQETSLYDYEKKAWIYNSNETVGDGIETDQSFDVEGVAIAPGETGTVTFTLVIGPDDITTADIQRYVVELGCWSATEAVYCPE